MLANRSHHLGDGRGDVGTLLDQCLCPGVRFDDPGEDTSVFGWVDAGAGLRAPLFSPAFAIMVASESAAMIYVALREIGTTQLVPDNNPALPFAF